MGNTVSSTAANFIFENVTIRCIPPESLYSAASSWTPSLFFTGSGAVSLTVRGKVAIEAPQQQVLLVDTHVHTVPVTIEKNSTLSIGPDVQFAFHGYDSASSLSTATLSMADQTSILHLNHCNFYIGSNGLTITKGTLLFENKVKISNKSLYSSAGVLGGDTVNTTLANGLTLGDGTSAENDVDVKVLGGSYVIVDGCINFKHS